MLALEQDEGNGFNEDLEVDSSLWSSEALNHTGLCEPNALKTCGGRFPWHHL